MRVLIAPGCAVLLRLTAVTAAFGVALSLALAAPPAGHAAPSGADDPGVDDLVTGALDGVGEFRFIVEVDPVDPPSEDDLRARGATMVRSLRYTPHTMVVVVPAHRLASIGRTDGVVGIEHDRRLELAQLPVDLCDEPPFSDLPEVCPPEEEPSGNSSSGTVTGAVTDAATGAAIEGAAVKVEGTGQRDDTDADGVYEITGVPSGWRDVTATASGYARSTETLHVPEEGTAEQDFRLELDREPQQTPWGIERIEAPQAWPVTAGAGTAVCVADTGIDRGHTDLAYAFGENFNSDDEDAGPDPGNYEDGHGHGTHVAGTLAAIDNDIGVVGAAHETSLLVAKVLGDGGWGYTSQIVDGLNWCKAAGADVVNMSFVGSGTNAMRATVEDLHAAGVTLVAATGNDGRSSPGHPAAYPEVIAVGATSQRDFVTTFSNRGEDLNAPGSGVRSTVPGGYDTASGTSTASPHVAGTAAMVIAVGEDDPDEVRSILRATADTPFGTRIVNAARAVEAASG